MTFIYLKASYGESVKVYFEKSLDQIELEKHMDLSTKKSLRFPIHLYRQAFKRVHKEILDDLYGKIINHATFERKNTFSSLHSS